MITSIEKVQGDEIDALSALATEIVREHFDPLVGVAQNSYMLARFQTPDAIRGQIRDGYRYYWVRFDGRRVGFFAFYPRAGKTYLSKFYVHKDFRGRGLSREMLAFVEEETRRSGLSAIFLNVNRGNADVIAIYRRLGFYLLREEKNDIGGGFFMDDLVLQKDVDSDE